MKAMSVMPKIRVTLAAQWEDDGKATSAFFVGNILSPANFLVIRSTRYYRCLLVVKFQMEFLKKVLDSLKIFSYCSKKLGIQSEITSDFANESSYLVPEANGGGSDQP